MLGPEMPPHPKIKAPKGMALKKGAWQPLNKLCTRPDRDHHGPPDPAKPLTCQQPHRGATLLHVSGAFDCGVEGLHSIPKTGRSLKPAVAQEPQVRRLFPNINHTHRSLGVAPLTLHPTIPGGGSHSSHKLSCTKGAGAPAGPHEGVPGTTKDRWDQHDRAMWCRSGETPPQLE